ncbi:MAG: HupE/UreJ family protein [Bacteroidota bacterium]
MGFADYIGEGIKHILDPAGVDHMLFLLVLAAVHQPREWKKVLVLATGFTIGHSITLALVAFGEIKPDLAMVEFLIPVTILLTILMNLFRLRRRAGHGNGAIQFLMVIGFGLIHGMGFSTYLKMLVGKGNPIAMPLLAYNIGVEIGQVIFLLAFFVVTLLIHSMTRIKHRDWVIFILGGGLSLTLLLISETWPW